jgi:hypothetical protein
MSNKHLLLLLVAAAIASVLAWQFSRPSERSADDAGDIASGELLFPEFAKEANAIDYLQVYGGGEQLLLELQRQDQLWTVAQKDAYPADWGKVRDLLRELGQARVIAPKTSREAMYPRLGVADISMENTGGGLLRWDQGADSALIIGIRSDDLEGRYVRKPEQAQSYLVDKVLEVPTRPRDWIDRRIVDWQGSRISAVTVRHADKDLIRLARPDEDALELQLQNLPEGRELTGQWAINGIVNALTGLQADNVYAATDPLPADTTRMLFVSDNGINLLLSIYKQTPAASELADAAEAETSYRLRAEASLEPISAEANNSTDADADPAGKADDGINAADSNAVADGAAQEVAELNQRLRGWEYVIPEYKFNALNKRQEDLLKPLPAAESDSGDD